MATAVLLLQLLLLIPLPVAPCWEPACPPQTMMCAQSLLQGEIISESLGKPFPLERGGLFQVSGRLFPGP